MVAVVRSSALAALVLAGCAKGDSLVVVTVDANPAIANVAVLKTTSMAGGQTFSQDVGGNLAPFSLGGGVTKSFAVQVPSSTSGRFSIHIEARGASGNTLAQGNGMTTLSPGNRLNLSVTLGPVAIAVEPVWIGSGGSAATATFQVNVNSGGTDTVGATAAPSGGTFTAGSFASQIN
jgi:hypothetical protein